MPAGEDGRLSSEVEALLSEQAKLSGIVVDLVAWLSPPPQRQQSSAPLAPPQPQEEAASDAGAALAIGGAERRG